MSTFRQKFQATMNRARPDPEDLIDTPRKRRRAAPVTAHRLFPAFAAVWFAALFGLGSLAIPGSLLGDVVLKTGLPAIVPAAAPPLGFTAHLLVAFALTVFGAALGLALALRLRSKGKAEVRRAAPVAPAAAPEPEAAYKVRARDAHPDAPPRRPLVVTEALVDPLAEEAVEPQSESETFAPLLRRNPRSASTEPAGVPSPFIPEFTPGGTGEVRPLDLSSLELDEPTGEPITAPAATEAAVAPQPESEPEPEPAPAPLLIAATPQLPVNFGTALPEAAEVKRSPVAGAPLENLGLVQLIERLALAIAEQKAANEAVIAADSAAEADAAVPEFEPGPFSSPRVASPASQGSGEPAIGAARESILRRLGAIAAGEAVDGKDSEAAARLFTRPAPVPAPVALQAEAVVPLRPVEPAASAPTAPVEADEALRSALATLKRMSARA